jgi:hypothetical protein
MSFVLIGFVRLFEFWFSKMVLPKAFRRLDGHLEAEDGECKAILRLSN